MLGFEKNKTDVCGWCCVLPACFDHRGTPENPARTCTLEGSKGAICVSINLSFFSSKVFGQVEDSVFLKYQQVVLKLLF